VSLAVTSNSQSAITAPTPDSVPRHIAVIMDGNGRWARSQGLPRLAGHERGSRAVGECVEGCLEAGVEFLTLYAFSAENWKRPHAEVEGLMMLLDRFLKEKTREMLDKGVRLNAIGRITDLPPACQSRLKTAITTTASNTKLTLTLALSYSGRLEIVDAIQSIVRDAREGRISEPDITPEFVSSRLYTADLPDPDLLIRTSGELRLSNFLLWQLSYTEIHVTPKLWPEFTREDLAQAISDFSRRDRRFGGVKS
jgi:undecaprenyl diphosphate synthase